MRHLIKFRFLFIIYFLLQNNIVLSQIDTLKLVKIINRNSDFSNIFVQFSVIKRKNNSEENISKKVWLLKNKENILKMRVQSFESDKYVTMIVNNKEKIFINHTSKRCDFTTFKLMDNKTLNDFNNQQIINNLPSFLIYSNKENDYLKNALQYYSNPSNASIQALNDTTINKFDCFVYKITDYDPNNGYLPDYTELSEGINAQYITDYFFFNKLDSTLIAQKTEYFYENSSNNHSIFEVIESVFYNNKQNEDNSIYLINTDTLRNSYFNTTTKYDGKYFICEINPISVKKVNISGLQTIDYKDLKDNNDNNFIMVFVDIGNEECWKNLIATKKQINNFRNKKLEILAVFNENININYKDFLKENNIKTLVSLKLFNKFVTDSLPLFVLIDKIGKIIDISLIMNKDILKKYVNY